MEARVTIRGLIFDFDGLILDTEEPDYLAWQEVYVAHGATLPLEVWAEHVGTVGTFDPAEYLEAQTGRAVNRDAAKAEQRRRVLELIHAQPVLPGVLDYIAEAQRRGFALGVASSASRDWVMSHLERLDLLKHFGVVRTNTDTGTYKPDPAVYRAALDALGLAGPDAIAFEDSAHGLAAAKAAGMFAVAVPNAATRGLALDIADRVLVSLADVPLSQLLTEIEAKDGM